MVHRKKDEAQVKEYTEGLKKIFRIKELGGLKWFLGMHIICDRVLKTIWLSQQSYIEKITNRFIKDLSRCPDVPMLCDGYLPTYP